MLAFLKEIIPALPAILAILGFAGISVLCFIGVFYTDGILRYAVLALGCVTGIIAAVPILALIAMAKHG